jgi:hypothetical protein
MPLVAHDALDGNQCSRWFCIGDHLGFDPMKEADSIFGVRRTDRSDILIHRRVLAAVALGHLPRLPVLALCLGQRFGIERSLLALDVLLMVGQE